MSLDVDMTLLLMLISAVAIAVASTLLTAVIFNAPSAVVILEKSTVMSPLLKSVDITLVLLVVPVTSSSVLGAVFLIPRRLVLTSKYSKSVSNERSTPSRNRLSLSIPPEIRPISTGM